MSAPTTRRRRSTTALLAAAASSTLLLAATGCGSSSGSGGSGSTGVSLILKTTTNPYFVSMEEDAKAEATKKGVELTVSAGKKDGDTQSQITAIDDAVSRGDAGILITSNGNAVNAALGRAKKAGLFVIALDTPPDPAKTADITFATDNEAAGKLIGQYAAAELAGKPAVVAMLDLYDDQVVSVDINRDHGFLEGMGIDPGSSTQNGKEASKGSYSSGSSRGSYTIACHQPTQGAIDGGRTAMENCLSKNPDINVVYSINEPAGEGAYAALKAAGKTSGVTIVSIDGSCSGLQQVTSGVLAADAVQYPGKMASLGVDAIAKLAKGGEKPSVTSGKSFYDTGTALVAGTAVDGVKSDTVDQHTSTCWGSSS